MRIETVYLAKTIKELPENWERRILLYRTDLLPVDTALFEEREGALMKIGGLGRLELSEVLLLDPMNVEVITIEGVKEPQCYIVQGFTR